MIQAIYRKHRRHLLSTILWKQRIIFIGGAVAVGIMAAGFARLCEYAQHLFTSMTMGEPMLPLVMMPLNFMLLAYVTKRFFPSAVGAGIPQVLVARKLRDEKSRNYFLSLKVAAAKIVLTALALMTGASTGREGPTVQVGAAIMLAGGKFFGRARQHGLILAGGAAGIAAAFNTPLAGIVFAIEELSKTFERRTNSLVLTAIIVAGVSSISLTGNYTYFGTTSATLGFDGWPAVILCGVIGGVLGGWFSKFVVAVVTGKLPFGISAKIAKAPIIFAGACGLGVALLGVISGGHVYGTGYTEVKDLLHGNSDISLWFGPEKIVATALTSVSGIAGGFFAPSLTAGAGVGAIIAAFFPAASFGAIVMLGMAGYFAGIVQVPITVFVIVFEMTDNHQMVVPIMAVSLIATAVSRVVCPVSIYSAIADKMMKNMPAQKA